MFDLDLFLIWVLIKFLWIHLGTLPGKLPPSLSPALAPLPTPGPRLPLPLPLPSWGQIFYRSYEASVHPEPKLRWPRSRETRNPPHVVRCGFLTNPPSPPIRPVQYLLNKKCTFNFDPSQFLCQLRFKFIQHLNLKLQSMVKKGFEGWSLLALLGGKKALWIWAI